MASRFEEEEPAGMPPAEFPPEATSSRPKVIPIQPKAAEKFFPVTWISEAVLKLDTKPLVKGLIDPGAFVLIYGPSGSGKSFFTADLAQHIAQGAQWRGRKVTPGIVLYVASEAGSSILKRFVGWRDNKLGDAASPVPLAIMTAGPNLLNSVDFSKFEEQLQTLSSEFDLPLALVIFDTLSRSIPGGDENKAEDMTKSIESADLLRSRFNCATAFVHHTGKDQDRGARGHSSLFAAADLVLKVADKAATVEKVRDGVAGERFGFELQPIEIGTDSDGDVVYTCLLNPTDQPPQTKAKQPTGQNQKVVLPVIQALMAESKERSPGTSTIPRGVKLVSLATVTDRAVAKFGPDEPGYRARSKIKTAIVGLQSNGLIGVHDDHLWLL